MVVPFGDNFFSFSLFHLKSKSHLSLFLSVLDLGVVFFMLFGFNLIFGFVVFVRLNLFNHMLALFRTKFACNLAIRYLVFSWELCKGSV